MEQQEQQHGSSTATRARLSLGTLAQRRHSSLPALFALHEFLTANTIANEGKQGGGGAGLAAGLAARAANQTRRRSKSSIMMVANEGVPGKQESVDPSSSSLYSTVASFAAGLSSARRDSTLLDQDGRPVLHYELGYDSKERVIPASPTPSEATRRQRHGFVVSAAYSHRKLLIALLVGLVVLWRLVDRLASPVAEGSAEGSVADTWGVKPSPLFKGKQHIHGADTDSPSEVFRSSSRNGAGSSKEAARMHADLWRRATLWGAPDIPLDTLDVENKKGYSHEATFIFVHGMTEHAWQTPVQYQLADSFPHIKWVMPQAPDRPITFLKGSHAPAWYDIASFPDICEPKEDAEAMFASARYLNAVIRRERAHLAREYRAQFGDASKANSTAEAQPTSNIEADADNSTLHQSEAERKWVSERLVLGGFSQGSVMSLLTGLTAPDQLAGLVVMSGYLPLRTTMADAMIGLDARRSTPILMMHGVADPYLLVTDAQRSADLMRHTDKDAAGEGGLGITDLTYHEYPGLEHAWTQNEFTHMRQWLTNVLPKSATAGTRNARMR